MNNQEDNHADSLVDITTMSRKSHQHIVVGIVWTLTLVLCAIGLQLSASLLSIHLPGIIYAITAAGAVAAGLMSMVALVYITGMEKGEKFIYQQLLK